MQQSFCTLQEQPSLSDWGAPNYSFKGNPCACHFQASIRRRVPLNSGVRRRTFMHSKYSLVVTFFVTVICAGCTLDDPSQVSQAHLESYKAGVLRGCKNSAAKTGYTTSQADTFCRCTIRVNDEKLGEAGWRKVVFLDSSGRYPEAEKLLASQPERYRVCARLMPAQ
jgi:hypothetical protein